MLGTKHTKRFIYDLRKVVSTAHQYSITDMPSHKRCDFVSHVLGNATNAYLLDSVTVGGEPDKK